MTAPEPTPEPRPALDGGHDPWGAASPPAPAEPVARRWWREIRGALLVAVPVAVLTGPLLGLLWLWRAPRVPLVASGNDVILAEPEGQQAFGADGTFFLAGLAVGAVAGVLVFLLRRHGGVASVIGLAAGALLGSFIAWRIGVWFGPEQDVAAHARAAGDAVFDAPLDLGARGVLLGLPFAALGLHLICTALWGPRDPQQVPAEFPRWGEAAGGPGPTPGRSEQ
ncbi:ABC transporter permease [Streptomyces millisiae]|uniref:ABC transporter permease n=1 Tax=Streptomyces millisiae TaxID=3075542 RepID=A0ABU2LT35_9ACTN|nr:ABC transporter permease [Streptomyces sp. DSM 44918]MDT0320755.1 ABC transporter permease [Streptomyces sp. DSM 44918]